MGKMIGVVVLLAIVLAGPAVALNVFSDGSDGALNVPAGSGNYTIDLSNAVTGDWQTAGNGSGIYDPAKWAVVFKYTSVTIPAGRTVVFTNHPSRAPVIWLVSGNATIAGAIKLSGESYGAQFGSYTEPGPGGFRGGTAIVSAANLGCSGFGPGGGGYNPGGQGAGGGFGSVGAGTNGGPAYGNPRVLPLVGGSGGAGYGGTNPNYSYSGGAGGGAILIACAGTLGITGQITSSGGQGYYYNGNGSGAGSGGGIRIITNAFLAGSVATGITAVGGTGASGGGDGRIRIETNSFAGFSGSSSPDYSRLEGLGTDAVIFPAPDVPTVRLVSVGGIASPSDPRASFAAPGDIWVTDGNAQEVILETTNVPTDGTWAVMVRVAPVEGAALAPVITTVLDPGPPARWHGLLPNLPVIRVTDLHGRAAKIGS